MAENQQDFQQPRYEEPKKKLKENIKWDAETVEFEEVKETKDDSKK